MDDDWLTQLATLERSIVAYDRDPDDAAEGIATLTGTRPVVISAPHATRHWRDAAWKREEEYTAAMAHWLHRQTGVHAVYATHRLRPDPHADHDTNQYKQVLARLVRQHGIQLVVDLHGARGDRDFALALGTINGTSCAAYEVAIVGALVAAGFQLDGSPPSLDRLALNPPRYRGGVQTPTITRFASRTLGVAAVQIELNAWARIVTRLPEAYEAQKGIAPHFRGDPVRIRRVLEGLLRVVAAAEQP
ncbi:MAG: hypothetical protein Kow0077_08680 [Anaerolineae bacterium]